MPNTPEITVYTKDDCRPCTATKRKLTQHGLEYVEVNLDADEEARERLYAEGFRESPVVITRIGKWSGFRPDLIEFEARLRAGYEADKENDI